MEAEVVSAAVVGGARQNPADVGAAGEDATGGAAPEME